MFSRFDLFKHNHVINLERKGNELYMNTLLLQIDAVGIDGVFELE